MDINATFERFLTKNIPKMNKNYPIYKTTFIDDMRSLVEEDCNMYLFRS